MLAVTLNYSSKKFADNCQALYPDIFHQTSQVKDRKMLSYLSSSIFLWLYHTITKNVLSARTLAVDVNTNMKLT